MKYTHISDEANLFLPLPNRKLFEVRSRFHKGFLGGNKIFEYDEEIKRKRGRPNSSARKIYNQRGPYKPRQPKGVRPLPVGPSITLTALLLMIEGADAYKDLEVMEIQSIINGDVVKTMRQYNKFGTRISDFIADQMKQGDSGLIPENLRNKNDAALLANYMLDGTINSKDKAHQEQIATVGQMLLLQQTAEENNN